MIVSYVTSVHGTCRGAPAASTSMPWSRSARAEPRRVHRPLRHARRDHGPGPRHPQGGAAHPARAGADGADARRGAGRRFRRNVRPAAALRQVDGELCRSRTLPSTYAKGEEMRGLQVDPAPPAPRAAGRARTRATRTRSSSQALGSIGLFGRPRCKTSLLSAADIKAIPFVIHLMRPSRGSSTGSAGTSAGSTCRCRSRCTPTASTW